MTDFPLTGTVVGAGGVLGGVWPSITGAVIGDGSAANNVRGRVVAGVFSSGLVLGAGVVTGLVSRSLIGTVLGVGSVTGAVRSTPRVTGLVSGAGLVSGSVAWDAHISGSVLGAGAVIGNPSPAVAGVVSGLGVLTGFFASIASIREDVIGVANITGVVRAQFKITGLVSGAGSVTGTVRTGPKITGSVVGTQALSAVLRVAAHIPNTVVLGVGEVTGSLVRERPATSSAEGGYESTGTREALPILVYALGVLRNADLGAVPAGGNFLVGASYVGAPGDPFYEAGAAPNAIGTLVRPSTGVAYLIFRAPLPFEVVWYVPGEQTYRFAEDRDTSESSWAKYRTMPQRAVDGMRVFDIFDPDGIYRYVAKIFGAMQYQLGYDNQVLLDQYDPDKASRFYLPELAANFGLTLDWSDDLTVKRAKTRNAVSVSKLKALDSGVRLRLRSLGLTGYANEIWVAPEDPGNFQSAAVNDNGTPTSSSTGAGTVYREYPHGYRADDPSDGYYPSSRLAVHLNDGSGEPLLITADLKERVARDLGRDVLPLFVDIRYFVTDVLAASDGLLVSDELTISSV